MKSEQLASKLESMHDQDGSSVTHRHAQDIVNRVERCSDCDVDADNPCAFHKTEVELILGSGNEAE